MSICQGCGQEIKWIRTAAGKSMPVDEGIVHFTPAGGPMTFITADGKTVRILAFEEHLPEHHALFSAIIDDFATDREKAAIEQVFSECKPISIDYGIMEKADNVYVSCGDFGWSDVGTWGSVYQLSRKDRYANVKLGDGCYTYDTRSTIISVPEGKVAIINGLKEYIVIDTDDVLMICPRSEEQSIKKYIDEVKFEKGDKYI